MPSSAAAKSLAADGIVELADPPLGSPFFSADMAPVSRAGRRWGMKDIAVLWISLSACIPTYMQASSAINQGMNWWQAVLTIFLGNLIVLVPMVLNAHAGTKYGIPFPVYCRASFGILGANIPALLRAIVACGWFGIQTWIGGGALYAIVTAFFPAARELPVLPIADINAAQLGCFFAFWLVNMLVIYLGIESIRVLLNIKAPLLIVLGLALFAWAYFQVGGFGPMFAESHRWTGSGNRPDFWKVFLPVLTANVGFWATLALNIPDFSRYARSQRDQVVGQAIGLPLTMGLYSFIGVAVTSAAYTIYSQLPEAEKDKLWDPVFLLSLFPNRAVLVFAMISLCLATLATNIAANVVSPANDFAHLWPRKISFRTGGFITGVIGILIQPWHLVANAAVYIGKWLIGYSSLLGAVGGVLIADYFVIRRTQLDQRGLYLEDGPYWYRSGFNPRAIVALLVGIGLCVPGFLSEVGKFALQRNTTAPPELMRIPDFWGDLYSYAWFTSFGVSFAVYIALMLIFRGRKSALAA